MPETNAENAKKEYDDLAKAIKEQKAAGRKLFDEQTAIKQSVDDLTQKITDTERRKADINKEITTAQDNVDTIELRKQLNTEQHEEEINSFNQRYGLDAKQDTLVLDDLEEESEFKAVPKTFTALERLNSAKPEDKEAYEKFLDIINEMIALQTEEELNAKSVNNTDENSADPTLVQLGIRDIREDYFNLAGSNKALTDSIRATAAAITNGNNMINRKQNDIASKQQELDEKNQAAISLLEQEADYNKIMFDYTNKEESIKTQTVLAEGQRGMLKTQRQAFLESQNKVNALKAEIDQANAQNEEVSAEKQEEFDKAQKDLDENVNIMEQLRVEHKSSKKHLSNLKNEFEDLKERRKNYIKTNHSAKNDAVHKARSDANKLRKEIKSLNEELNGLNKNVEALKKQQAENEMLHKRKEAVKNIIPKYNKVFQDRAKLAKARLKAEKKNLMRENRRTEKDRKGFKSQVNSDVRSKSFDVTGKKVSTAVIDYGVNKTKSFSRQFSNVILAAMLARAKGELDAKQAVVDNIKQQLKDLRKDIYNLSSLSSENKVQAAQVLNSADEKIRKEKQDAARLQTKESAGQDLKAYDKTVQYKLLLKRLAEAQADKKNFENGEYALKVSSIKQRLPLADEKEVITKDQALLQAEIFEEVKNMVGDKEYNMFQIEQNFMAKQRANMAKEAELKGETKDEQRALEETQSLSEQLSRLLTPDNISNMDTLASAVDLVVNYGKKVVNVFTGSSDSDSSSNSDEDEKFSSKDTIKGLVDTVADLNKDKDPSKDEHIFDVLVQLANEVDTFLQKTVVTKVEEASKKSHSELESKEYDLALIKSVQNKIKCKSKAEAVDAYREVLNERGVFNTEDIDSQIDVANSTLTAAKNKLKQANEDIASYNTQIGQKKADLKKKNDEITDNIIAVAKAEDDIYFKEIEVIDANKNTPTAADLSVNSADLTGMRAFAVINKLTGAALSPNETDIEKMKAVMEKISIGAENGTSTAADYYRLNLINDPADMRAKLEDFEEKLQVKFGPNPDNKTDTLKNLSISVKGADSNLTAVESVEFYTTDSYSMINKLTGANIEPAEADVDKMREALNKISIGGFPAGSYLELDKLDDPRQIREKLMDFEQQLRSKFNPDPSARKGAFPGTPIMVEDENCLLKPVLFEIPKGEADKTKYKDLIAMNENALYFADSLNESRKEIAALTKNSPVRNMSVESFNALSKEEQAQAVRQINLDEALRVNTATKSSEKNRTLVAAYKSAEKTNSTPSMGKS
ncbi:MAG: hypothetical protein LUC92_10360 [Clostridiales bacterium]|nr:hypothetical protein [Clostridiales bacterium]